MQLSLPAEAVDFADYYRSDFEIWFIPTLRGRSSFSWGPRRVEVLQNCTLNDAHLARYLISCDEPSPDKYEYYSIVLIEVRNPCKRRLSQLLDRNSSNDNTR